MAKLDNKQRGLQNLFLLVRASLRCGGNNYLKLLYFYPFKFSFPFNLSCHSAIISARISRGVLFAVSPLLVYTIW